jgi:tetratricopeptide (TPR) repeat protein
MSPEASKVSRQVAGSIAVLTSLVVAVLLIVPSAVAQQRRWSWPEKPKNLQVFPKDTPGSELRGPMIGFARSLGVHCAYCHVGEEGKPLQTYDFASDDNPNKNRAREMMRMMKDIHGHLEKIQPSGKQRVRISCYTCHHGRPKPLTLGEELTESYQKNGLEGALATYDQLHEDYYGRGVYNFESDEALNELGYAILSKGDYPGAIRVFKLNTEKFPKSGNVWDSLAEAYLKTGDTDSAEKYYRKSLELDPRNRNAAAMLKKIKEGGGD